MLVFLYKNSQVVTEVSCHLEDASCHVLGLDSEFRLSVKPFPIKTEEQLIFTLELEPGLQFESAWVQGINMYMGKIPVLPLKDIDVSNENLQLESYLGSCSEPNMRWQMIINLSHENGTELTRYINFSSTAY